MIFVVISAACSRKMFKVTNRASTSEKLLVVVMEAIVRAVEAIS
jgi:hypothetical protein